MRSRTQKAGPIQKPRWRHLVPSRPSLQSLVALLLVLGLLAFGVSLLVRTPLELRDDTEDTWRDRRSFKGHLPEGVSRSRGEEASQKMLRKALGLESPSLSYRDAVKRRNVTLAVDCSEPDIMAIAWGNVAERMQRMCLAKATAIFLGAKLCVLWLPSQGMEHVAVSDLFQGGTEFVHKPRDSTSMFGQHTTKNLRGLQVDLGVCRALSKDTETRTTSDMFVSADFGDHVSQLHKGSCIVLEEAERCYNELIPSPGVATLLAAAGNNLARVQASRAAFVEDIRPSGCGGCPYEEGNENSTDAATCVLRVMVREYLRDPSADFTVASLEPGADRWIAGVFDPARAPFVPMSARFLAGQCQAVIQAGAGGRGTAGGMAVPPRTSGDAGVRGTSGPLAAGASLLGSHGVPRPEGNASSLSGGHRALLQAKVNNGLNMSEMRQQRSCAQHELALLLLLASARGSLVHLRSSPQSQFIAALQRQRSVFSLASTAPALRRREHSPHTICATPKLLPITKERFAKFFVVEEKLNLAYCAVPKVACTGWKMWFRSMLGLPDPLNPYLAHSYEKSGLGDLSKSFSEAHAVRLLTKPGLFKFVLVRNPFTRITSTYLNKLVYTDAPDRTEGWGTRAFWNIEFFGKIWPLFTILRSPQTQLVTFDNFLVLIQELMRRRVELERHIATQRELCGLDQIRYDFVGKFESLAADVERVTSRFGNKNLSVFTFNVHPTNTDANLRRLYTETAYRRVFDLYRADLDVPLNGIHYSPPELLQTMFGDPSLNRSRDVPHSGSVVE